VSSHFYCHIQPELVLYDAEHNLVAIAKFLILLLMVLFMKF